MTTTLFGLLMPSVHTTFVFELPENQSRGPLQLRTSCTCLENIIKMMIAENAPFPRSGRVVGGLNRVPVDTEGGHMASMLTQVWKSFPSVVIIRPDACIGACVHDPEGVAKYFSKICLCVAVQLRTLLSSLDTIQEVLGLTHLSWLVASIEEFPVTFGDLGALCRISAWRICGVLSEDGGSETVKHANCIRASCFSSSTRARAHDPYFLVIHLIHASDGRQHSPLTFFISRCILYRTSQAPLLPTALLSNFTNGVLCTLLPTSSIESKKALPLRLLPLSLRNAFFPCHKCCFFLVAFTVRPGHPAFPLVAHGRTQTPTSLATQGTADPKDSPAYSHRVPYYQPSPYPHSSLSPHRPSSQSPSPSFCPPHHASVQNPFARSSIHSSFRNPSPSRQNGSWPRGAPHLPHIRNTLDIVLPQPLTPTSFPDHIGYGGVSSVNRRDSRHLARSADSWARAAISRTSSQARLTDVHLPSESQSPSAWRSSGVPPVPLVLSPFDEGLGE